MPMHDLTKEQQKVMRHLFIPSNVSEDAMMGHARKIVAGGAEVWVHKHSYSQSCADEFGCVHLSPDQPNELTAD